MEFIELDKINNHHFDLIINETKIDKLKSHSHIKLSETQIIDYKDIFNSLDQNKIVNLNYSSLYFNSFIYSGLRYLTEDFREIFFDYISNKIKINDKYNDSIIFHIGSISRKDGDYNDKIFQSHIIKLVNTFTNKKFILLGLDSDIKNDNFKTILKKDNVNNLISKTDNVSELMEILFNSKLFIGKSSFLLHLAGCCKNKKIIYFFSYSKGIEYLLNFFRQNILVDENIFFKERFAPLSKNST